MEDALWLHGNFANLCSKYETNVAKKKYIALMAQKNYLSLEKSKNEKLKIEINHKNLLQEYSNCYYVKIASAHLSLNQLELDIFHTVLNYGQISKDKLLKIMTKNVSVSIFNATMKNLIEVKFILKKSGFKFIETDQKLSNGDKNSAHKPKIKKIDENEDYLEINKDLMNKLIMLDTITEIAYNKSGSFIGDQIRKVSTILIAKEMSISFAGESSEIANQMASVDIISQLNSDIGGDNFLQCQKFFNFLNDVGCEAPFIHSVSNYGHSSSLGQKYYIDWSKNSKYVVMQYSLSYIAKIYGTTGLVIFEMIRDKGPMSQNDAEKLSLLPPNDFRETVFTMIKDSVLSLMEFSKLPDYNPSKTIYLLKNEYENIVDCIYSRMKVQLKNIYSLKHRLFKSNETIVEKKSNFDRFKETNIDGSAEDVKLEDVMTSGEISSLEAFEKKRNLFDAALLRLVPIFLFFDMYRENIK